MRENVLRRYRWPGVLLVLALGIAACAGDAGETTTTAGSDATTTSSNGGEVTTTSGGETTTTAEAGGLPEGEVAFKVGHVSAGSIYDQVPVITNARLNAEGWNVEDVYFARTELTPQALAQNSIQISVNLYLEPLRTIQAGGPDSKLQFVMENNGAEFIIVAKAEYPTCQDMGGIRFGIHGETSTVSVAAVKWLNEECGVEPNVLVIPGGDNRIIALENDELDATLVQLGDWLALEAVADEGEYVIVDAGESMAFSGAGYFLNTDWLEQNHDVAVAYVGELLRTYQIIHEDPTVLEEAVRANVEVPEETIAESVRLYLDPTLVNLAPIDPLGGSSDVLQATIDYFTPDELDEGMDINDFYDPALLEEAIAYMESTS